MRSERPYHPSRVRVLALGVLIVSVGPPSARAKEDHLERVKNEVIALYIQCRTCHTSDAGPALTAYGRRIADLGPGQTVPERVARMERRLSDVLTDEQRRDERARVDVDGDGALNWVEILCGTDPSDPTDAPAGPRDDHDTPTLRERVESVMDCRLCHTRPSTGLRRGDAPHNPFGDAIHELKRQAAPPARGGSRGRTVTPPPPDFWQRFLKLRYRDTDLDRARNWDEISTFHHPADKTDTPTADEIKRIRERFNARRRSTTGYGKQHAP